MQTINLVKDALKHKAPQLYRSLAAKGELNEYAQGLAEQISSQVVTLTQAQRAKEKWDKLGPVECAARMRTASSLNREIVLAEMLEFPQDGTSPPSPDESLAPRPGLEPGTYGLTEIQARQTFDELSETSHFPVVDRLAYDIQWLRSAPGQKFEKEFTKYLDELASDGKYSAKLKVFSVDDGMLIELPSGKEIPCDMEWDSFEQLMSQLELEITETTSTGVVKLKWG